MLASALVPQLWRVLHERKPMDRGEYLAALASLPDSWEHTRRKRRHKR